MRLLCWSCAFLAVSLVLFVGYLVVPPRESSVSFNERLAQIPTYASGLHRPVTIHWDSHQIPFIEAETDEDLAYTVGLVHAHLRLAQMEMLRRMARGRLAESLGSPAVEFDRMLKLLDFGRAAPAVISGMPADSRQFLSAYVAGINFYLRATRSLPHEFALLGLGREPWKEEDIVAIGRMFSLDVNWIVWFQLLRKRASADWPEFWRGLFDDDAGVSLWPAEKSLDGLLMSMLLGAGRTGSNALAIAGRRTKSGGAIVAGDPHLGLFLPNPWLVAALNSPSYHTVGLMLPGLPFIALGRNSKIAWSGTNLHAASSDLVDVSDLPPAAFKTRRERIDVRFWFDNEIDLRESPFGPVISDSVLFPKRTGETVALKWIGHGSSDEITAMLGVNRAQNSVEIRRALADYAVPGETFLYGDIDGHIGRITAAKLPQRDPVPPDDLVVKPQRMGGWDNLATTGDLPSVYDPAEGFVASANDRPNGSPVPIGWFFSPEDRMRRLTALLGSDESFDLVRIGAILLDTHLSSASAFRDRLLPEITTIAADLHSDKIDDLVGALKSWDGNYGIDSHGAAAFELLVARFARALLTPEELDALELGWRGRKRIYTAIDGSSDSRRATALAIALPLAAKDFAGASTWGSLHRLVLRHPLALVPIIEGLYRFTDTPAAGSADTLDKTMHGLVFSQHAASYGSTARYVIDLADPNGNYFVLLGGEDGFLGSTNFVDQVPLWLAGKLIQVPLTVESARARFHYRTQIRPTEEPSTFDRRDATP